MPDIEKVYKFEMESVFLAQYSFINKSISGITIGISH